MEMPVKPDKPYKYLDHYELGDHAIFRGREREIRSLVTDVSVSRLVVLFAETGTGKTSLINAGVRPRLENWRGEERPPLKARQYATYFIRVGEDPAQSIRAELQDFTPVTALGAEDPIAPALKQVVQFLDRPIVLFLDQFEEFFLYRDPVRKKRFIEDVAALYADEEAGVHLVFSMREEFVGKMDIFREEIPTIFHKDSQLRLAWFDREQAKEAIALPPQEFGVRVDDELVDVVLKDLMTEDGVEPAQLQIICYSLWNSRQEGERKLTLDHYRKLADDQHQIKVRGLDVMEDSLAKRVLGTRFENALGDLQRRPALDTLGILLQELCTEEGTKRIRELSGLASVSGIEAGFLPEVADYLTSTRLTKKRELGGITYIELAHDYLVRRMPALRARVHTLRARRILNAGMSEFRRTSTLLLPEELGEVFAKAEELEFDSEQAEFLLLSALEWDSYPNHWFQTAARSGTDVWRIIGSILETNILERVHVAQSALYLLSEDASERALDLLEKSLTNDALAPTVIDALVNTKTERAVKLLADVLHQRRHVIEAINALKILSRIRNETVAQAARKEIERYQAEDLRHQLEVAQPFELMKPLQLKKGSSSRGYTGTRIPPPFVYLRKLFLDGTIVPFVGAGINAAGRPQGAIWYEGAPFLPFGSELAEHLAKMCAFPLDQNVNDPIRVGSYFEETIGRSELRNSIRRVCQPVLTPTAVHRYFAKVPAPMLILTTNFDDLMERAFQEVGKPYNVVTHDFDQKKGTTEIPHVLWYDNLQSVPKRLPGNRLDIDLKVTSVIYKVTGSYNAYRGSHDSYAATEDDYIDMLPGLFGQQKTVPSLFLEHIRSRPFLFMGISLDNWYLRGLFRALRGGSPEASKSWAILLNPSEYTARLWAQQGVEVCDMRAEDFILSLMSVPPE